MELDRLLIGRIAEANPGDFAIYQLREGCLSALCRAPSLPGISGMTSEEYDALCGQDAAAIVLEADRPRVAQAIRQILAGGGDSDLTYRILHKTAGAVWVHARARLLGTLEGSAVLLTQFLNTSAEAREFDELLNNAVACICVMDAQTDEILYLNEKGRRLYGEGADYTGTRCYRYINGQDAPCAWCPFQYLHGSPVHLDACYVPPLNRWFRTDCREMNWFGRPARVLYAIDVTARIRRQQSLETDKKQLEEILHDIPGGIGVLHEEDGRFVLDYINEGYAAVHGGSRAFWEGFMGERIIERIWEADRALLLAERDRMAKDPAHEGDVTYRVIGEDGVLHWVNGHFRPAYRKDGILHYYASFTAMDAQKAAEARLADSQRALHEAVANSDIQYFTWFPDSHSCELYAACERLPELPAVWPDYPEDFLRYAKASPEDAQTYRAMLQRVAEGADDAECTVRFAYGSTWYWEKMHLHAVRGADGRLLRAQGYSRDVTARHEAQERLQKERVRMKSLEGNVIEAFSFNVTQNSLAEVATGGDPSLGEPVPDAVRAEAAAIAPSIGGEQTPARRLLLQIAAHIPDDAQRRACLEQFSGGALRKACAEGRFENEMTYRRKVGGVLRWVSTAVQVLPDPDTGDQIAFFYTRDVHSRRLYQQTSDHILNQNYFAISFYDSATELFYSHYAGDTPDSLEKGEKMEDAIRRAMDGLGGVRDRAEAEQQLSLETIRERLAEKPVYSFYFETGTEDGPARRLKNEAFYLDDEKSVIVLLLSDVTEIFEQERENRERLTQALQAAEQASVAKTEFLSRMSHEIRTPMNAIIGLDAIALQEKPLSAAMEDHLQKIGISARFLLSLINDILDMSRIESGRMALKNEVFDFEELIGSINTILYEQCRDSGLDYDCAVKNFTEPQYVGDRTKLQQVLVNILGNAVKFTPEGGKVHFLIEQISRSKEKARLRFEISDTGIGIDEEFLPHLFEPFSQENRGRTSAYGGTGLGLAICRNIVNLMGGSIRVHSIKNIGSEFTVEVELGLTDAAIRRRTLSAQTSLNPLYTLIVDDDVIVCRHTQMVLKEAGLRAEWVDSGAAAVDRVTEGHRACRDYDLILLDWKMPDMDGVETARRIRTVVGPDVTIIIMTAYDWAEIEEKALAAGVDLFMKKPVFASSVTRAFEQVFRHRSSEEPAPEPCVHDYTGRRILVAEDNTLNAEITCNLLAMKGCKTEVAENGVRAIEAFASSPAGYFDAILMDVRMPVMDGLEATKSIRAMKKANARTIPILAMTANAFEEDVRMSMAAGMNEHLAKPIEPELLYHALDRYLPAKADR